MVVNLLHVLPVCNKNNFFNFLFLFLISLDKLAYIWDITTCQRVKKLKGHQSFVNSIGYSRIGKDMICTGSDDGTVKVWDRRTRGEVMTFESTYQVLSCCFNASSDAVFSGGIDNTIKMWDIRKQEVSLRLDGHLDSPTGLELSQDGAYLASNSMDSTIRIWDIRPYFNGVDRCIKLLQGHQHNFEKNLLRVAWSPDGKRISCGSADKHVYIWDVVTRKILYRLPGHLGSVNEVDFHPMEPIIASCSSDKTVFLGEIEP
jgi:Prp8 binding protein